MSNSDDFDIQMAVARQVMAKRTRALGALADCQRDMAENIIDEDDEILRKLAQTDD